jgi:hypothetical protein
VRIDHVIVAAADLAAATARVEEQLGIAATGGGSHDGLGTHNRVLPVDGGFLEVLAVRDPGEAAQSVLGRLLVERIGAVGEGLLSWAVAVEDANAVMERLGVSAERVTRDGRTGQLAGLLEALSTPPLPFFIQRPEASGPSGFESIELAGDGRVVEAWLGEGHGLPLRFVDRPPGLVAVRVGGRELRY